MKSILTSVLFLFLYSPLFCQTITIGNGGDFATLEDAAPSISAGDTVLIFDGIYSDGSQFLEDLNGTESSPIVIMAENQHEAIFQGGTEAIHLINCSYMILDGLLIEQQTGNGINIDDGGDYDTPTHHITIRNCLFRDMAAGGNHDLLKLSGLNDFVVSSCQFLNGADGGSGVDMVGCHNGVIEDCLFDEAGVSGIQNKGGTQFILIQRNVFTNMAQRALNLGGSTGLQYFRPPLSNPIVDAFEAADIDVFSNVFIGSWAPIAYVGCVRVKVYNNTFYQPENWVIRILQETDVEGFLTCADNEFINNIVYLENDLTEVNIGPDTAPETFTIENNIWFNENSSSWSPNLPVSDPNQMIVDPLFVNAGQSDFHLQPTSQAIAAGQVLAAPLTDFYQDNFNSPPSVGAIEGNPIMTLVSATPFNNISVYPNPTSGRLTFKGLENVYEIRVFDMHQKPLRNFDLTKGISSVDVSNLSNGLYVIEIKDPQTARRHYLKFIKL